MASCINAYDVQSEAEYKFGYEFILVGIIERIENQLNELNIEYDVDNINQIYDFLAPHVDGKVWISFDTKTQPPEHYLKLSIALKMYTLNLAYGVNTIESRFPNALCVSICPDYEKMFRNFWAKKYLPTCLLEESIANLDLTQQIIVQVYEDLYHWKGTLNSAKNPIVIGQDLSSKSFKPFRPIGFVDGNFLVITSPNEKNDPVGITYNFN